MKCLVSKITTAVSVFLFAAVCSNAQDQSTHSAIVEAWARSFSLETSIELVIEDDVPQVDPDGIVIARNIYEMTYAFRWPDGIYTKTELIRTEKPDRTINYRTDDDPAVRAASSRNMREEFRMRSARVTQRYEGIGRFKRLGEGALLRDSVESYVFHAPVLLPMWIQSVGIDLFRVTNGPDGSVHVRHKDGWNEYTLANEGPSGELVVTRIRTFSPEGVFVFESAYRDFKRINSADYPVALVRSQSRPATAVRATDGDKPIGETGIEEAKEFSVDRVVSYSVSDSLPDRVFTPDLQDYTTLDESSGQLFDAEGNQVGQITARRKISRPKQWSTLIGAAGVAVLVFAAGAWWIRRRAA